MEKSKMLCLNWNDFSSSLSDSAKELKDDQDFLDVTLAFDDDEQIQGNKFMLSICSPFFRRILKRNKHSRPLLYLKGIKSENMRKMIEFIYHGEVHVPEQDLDCFLSNANDLQLKGLSEQLPVNESTKSSPNKTSKNIEEQSPSTTTKPGSERNYSNSVEVEYPDEYTNDEQSDCAVIMDDDDDIVSYDNPEISYDETSYAEADESLAKSFIDDNMLVENGIFACKECGKVFSKKQVLKNHIEIHMDNKPECTICHKSFKTSNSLKSHMSQRHKN